MVTKIQANTTAAFSQLAETYSQRAIARDTSGKLWIVYRQSGSGGAGRAAAELFVAYSIDGGSSWTEEIAVTDAAAEIGYSLLLDTNDAPIVIYVYNPSSGSDEIRYVDRSGGSWNSPETVYTQVSGRPVVRACIDSTDAIHIVFYEIGVYQIKYITGTTGSWGGVEAVDSNGNRPSITVSGGDIPYVVFQGSGQQYAGLHLRYKTRIGGPWQAREQINTIIGSPTDATIAIDFNDNIHIAWHQEISGDDEIRYRKGVIGSWEAEIAVDTPDEQEFGRPVLVLDTSDNAYIVYQHDVSGAEPTDQNVYYRKIVGGALGARITLDSDILMPNAHSSVYTGLWSRYPSSCILDIATQPTVLLLDESNSNANVYYESVAQTIGNRDIGVRGTALVWFDEAGVERKRVGTLVTGDSDILKYLYM